MSSHSLIDAFFNAARLNFVELSLPPPPPPAELLSVDDREKSRLDVRRCVDVADPYESLARLFDSRRPVSVDSRLLAALLLLLVTSFRPFADDSRRSAFAANWADDLRSEEDFLPVDIEL